MKKSIKRMPKFYELKKKHKNKVNLINYNFKISNLKCGKYGFKTTKSIRLSYHQVEAVRKTIAFNYKKKIKFWFKVNFSEPLTSKKIGIRMGRGVGSLDCWICNVPKGVFLIEFSSLYYGVMVTDWYKLLYYISLRIEIPLIFFVKY